MALRFFCGRGDCRRRAGLGRLRDASRRSSARSWPTRRCSSTPKRSTKPRSITPSTTAKGRWAEQVSPAEAAGATETAACVSRRRSPASSPGRGRRARRWRSSTRRIGLLRGADAHAHVRVLAFGGRPGFALPVARRARRLGGRRRVGRERRDQGRAGLRGDAMGPTSSRRRACTTSATSAAARSTLKGETTSLTAGYAYSTEHDYRSNSFHVNARTDAFQHNTQFELSYARNFDQRLRPRPARERDAARPAGLRSRTRPAASPTTRRARRSHRHRHLRGELGAVVDAGHRRRSSRTPRSSSTAFRATRTAASSSATG